MQFTEEQKRKAREAMMKVRTQSKTKSTSSNSWEEFDRAVAERQKGLSLGSEGLNSPGLVENKIKKPGLLDKVGDFIKSGVKSLGDTATRMAVKQYLPPGVSQILPEKVNLPIVGETSLRYSDQPIEALKQQGEDALNAIPGGAGKKTAQELVEQGSKGFAGRLIRSAFRITDNDLKKKPTLIKDFLLERIVGTKRGIAKKADVVVDALENQLDSVIEAAAKKGSLIDAEDVVKNVEPLVKYYENSAFPEYAAVVEKKAAEFLKRGKIPLQEAQQFKRNTYRIIRETGYGQMMGADKETAKQLARGVKEGLEEAVPEIKKAGINVKLAIYGKARDLMERQINKMSANQLVPFKDIVLTGTTGSLVPTLVRMVVESTPFKTYVANILTSTKTQSVKNTLKRATPILKEVFRKKPQE